ncbi:MAG: hypothetical protein AAF703_22980 [Cyanobacteria bacterium P01_D01_bin.105]
MLESGATLIKGQVESLVEDALSQDESGTTGVTELGGVIVSAWSEVSSLA